MLQRMIVVRGTGKGGGKEAGSAGDDRHGKSIITFAAHSLQRRCRQARMAGHHVKEAAHADHIEVGAGGIAHRAVAHHVVTNDNRARPRQLERTIPDTADCWACRHR